MLVITPTLLAGFVGCTRRFFRKSADREVAEVLADKDRYPEWQIDQFYIYPDPRARFADRGNPDRPAMPPDDPGAYNLSPHPQRPGKAGVARIEGTGYLDILRVYDVVNRKKYEQLPAVVPAGYTSKGGAEKPPHLDKEPGPLGPFLLTLEQAVELGLVNSREFQTRREDLYLAALPVTLERFAFAPQFFLTEEALRQRTARKSTSGRTNTWEFTTNGGVSKLFSTGALLLARFANQTVINLMYNAPHTVSTSTVSLDVVQPLLRGGGRAVTLEPLTQSERDLLYEIRDYARFRKQFFVGIAGAVDPVSFPSGAGGGVGGGVGLGSFSVFRPAITPGGAGAINLGILAASTTEGYLPTLLAAAQLENEQKNVSALEYLLRLFDDFEKGGKVSSLQVGQVRSQLLQGQSTVLQRAQDLRDGLDRFKLQLGLPTNVQLELERKPLREIEKHLQQYDLIPVHFKAALEEAKKAVDYNAPEKLRPRLREIIRTSAITQGTRFRDEFLPRWDEWGRDKMTDKEVEERVRLYIAEVAKLTKQRILLEKEGKNLPEADELWLRELEPRIEVGSLEQAVRKYERLPLSEKAVLSASQVGQLAFPLGPSAAAITAALDEPTRALRRQYFQTKFDEALQRVMEAFELVLIEARKQRYAPLREGWPALPPVELAGEDLLTTDLERAQQLVVEAALTNRLDLMNQRARVVDAWRQVTIFANSLLGVFDVAYHFDSSTPAGEAKPLAFTGSRNRHQLFFNAELPLVRKAERNSYRAALIAYQRARRNLMAVEDAIAAAVRTEVRQLRLQAENYKIQQEAVALAYSQVENSLEQFYAPPDPTARQDTAAAAAALTQQLLSSQAGVPRSQNQLFAFWINYQLTRLQLYLDLELMPLDFRGVWIDELATRQRGTDPGQPRDPGGPGNGQPQSGRPRDERPEWLPELRPVTPAAPQALE
jgi:outer membrane protein TolC